MGLERLSASSSGERPPTGGPSRNKGRLSPSSRLALSAPSEDCAPMPELPQSPTAARFLTYPPERPTLANQETCQVDVPCAQTRSLDDFSAVRAMVVCHGIDRRCPAP